MGYALFPDDVSEASELCELADVRMYRDKRTGHGAFNREAATPRQSESLPPVTQETTTDEGFSGPGL